MKRLSNVAMQLLTQDVSFLDKEEKPLFIILLVVGLLLLIALLLVFFFSASRLSKYEPGEDDDIFLDKEEKH
jgi:flagellar basal body-associated protein FliL